MARPVRPSLRLERTVLRAGARLLVGMDEVGRGALAGPVCVGAVAIGPDAVPAPRGVADSKLLTPAARSRLLPALATWGLARAVGHASAGEVDQFGILGALRLAGRRALRTVRAQAGPADVVVLDGTHDWLSPGDLLDFLAPDDDAGHPTFRVITQAKADRTCASVAAASVLAKCERDALMVDLHTQHPEYGWADNKGYGAPEHLAALTRFGPSPYHRTSWRLPGAAGPGSALRAAADGG